MPGHCTTALASASNLNAAASSFYPNMGVHSNTYMWKVVHKKDRPGQMINVEAGTWGEDGSYIQLPANGTTYFRNWSLMQSYFHWDLLLQAAKKPRITELSEIDLNITPDNQLSVAERDIHVIDDDISVNAFPHQWYKGKASNANSAANDPKATGKEVEKYDN